MRKALRKAVAATALGAALFFSTTPAFGGLRQGSTDPGSPAVQRLTEGFQLLRLLWSALFASVEKEGAGICPGG